MISEINENKLFQLQIHFKIILEEGFKIIDENKSEFNIYHSLFKRYIYGFESLNILLKDFDSEKRYREQSISIILRASLLDYLTTLYLGTFQAEMKFNSELKVKYDAEIDKLTSEQIRRIISISENDKKTLFYNHKVLCQTVDLFKESFSHLFDPNIPIDYNKPGKSLRYKSHDDIKSTTIRKRLDDVSDQLQNIRYEDVFYLYDVYSKYDHFGTASMLLEYMDINTVITNFLGATFHIAEGVGFCIDLMIDETNCNSNFDKINHEISSLRGTVYSKAFWLSPEYKSKNQ
ncbi:hypothetical protein [Flavobacterium magnum]|uniref:hypothetical protein n=1 Tax=Flavobacterium magnum TaxID=2162713 RepID=UPI0011B1D3AA|nr:hypothetical protein [Flavobacterium magnum]